MGVAVVLVVADQVHRRPAKAGAAEPQDRAPPSPAASWLAPAFHVERARLGKCMAGEDNIVRVEALLSSGRAAEAARVLVGAAEAGQTAALVRLASWRIAGDVVRRDLGKARSLLAAAAAQGDAG